MHAAMLLSQDTVLRKLDTLGDRLSDMELLPEWTAEQQAQYNALDEKYRELGSYHARHYK